jgi:hypothetical protein
LPRLVLRKSEQTGESPMKPSRPFRLALLVAVLSPGLTHAQFKTPQSMARHPIPETP